MLFFSITILNGNGSEQLSMLFFSTIILNGNGKEAGVASALWFSRVRIDYW